MNCKIGDKVRFLNSTGGGIVVRFISKSIVAVQDEDGFEIPVTVNEVVVIDEKKDSIFSNTSYIQRFDNSGSSNTSIDDEENQEEYIEYVAPSNKVEDALDPSTNKYNVLLGFVPFNKQKVENADLDLFIINDSDYRIAYSISKWNEKELLVPVGSGIIESDYKDRICTLSRTDFLKLQVFNVSIIFFKNREFTPVPPVQINMELNPLKFVKLNSFIDNDYFNDKASVFTVISSSKTDIISTSSMNSKILEESLRLKKEERPQLNYKSTPEQEEVDLHIESLIDDSTGLSNGEILEIQLARFTTALEGAIRSKTKRIIFIHGVGNGKLKNEVRKSLEKNYSKLRFQDASFKEYGYGATLVLLK